MSKQTPLEASLAWQLKIAGLPLPVTEYLAIPGRKFRFDLAWPEHRLLVEVQGAVWLKGAHSGGVGINRDAEKLNLAVLAGWRVLQVTTNHIRDGKALQWIRAAFKEEAA